MSAMRPGVLLCLLLTVSAGEAAPGAFSEYGLRFMSPGSFSFPAAVEAKRVLVRPGAPSADTLLRVDLSDQMPPVGSQGGIASCLSWGFTYYHRTHNEWLERRWDLSDPHHQCSPAFTNNLTNHGQGGPSGDVCAVMCGDGVASMADFPYDAHDTTSLPSESNFRQAMCFRACSTYVMSLSDTAGINRVRQLLANGFTCVFCLWAYYNFPSVREFNNVYCLADTYGVNLGGHCVAFVGYDDTMATADGPGAFRLVNSWGT